MRLGLAIFILCLSTPAWAVTPAQISRAQTLSAEGAKAFRAQNFEVALAKFQAANRIVPHPNLDVNIGRAYEALGQPDQAMVHCKIALNSVGVPQSTRKAARACVDRVTEQIARPTLTITSTPPGAVVHIDGRSVGKTPWRGGGEPGRRQIDLELDGFMPQKASINAERGQTYPLNLKLERAIKGGQLSVNSLPSGATVIVDGRMIGQTPIINHRLDAGSYRLEVRLTGYRPFATGISIVDGKTLQQNTTLVAKPVAPPQVQTRWPAWALMGAGVAAAGAGGYFGFRASQTRDDADTLARTSRAAADKEDYDGLLDTMSSQQTTADILFLTGGTAFAGGLTWLLWPDD